MLQEYRKDRERLAELHVNKGLDLAEIHTSATVLLFLTHMCLNLQQLWSGQSPWELGQVTSSPADNTLKLLIWPSHFSKRKIRFVIYKIPNNWHMINNWFKKKRGGEGRKKVNERREEERRACCLTAGSPETKRTCTTSCHDDITAVVTEL